MIFTREQTYAAKIYEQVEGIKNNLDIKSDYKNMSEKLPILIRSAGLVQALHFAKTRNDGSRKLIEHLQDTLDKQDLLEESRTQPITEYIFLTENCLLALKWYKRFAKIHLEDQENDN